MPLRLLSRIGLVGLTLALLVSITPAAYAQTEYTVTDLSTLGGPEAAATSISNEGHVVGGSDNADGQTRAFLWTPEAGMLDLGTLGGAHSYAFGIADGDKIVGYANTPSGAVHAFFLRYGETMQDIHSFDGPASYSQSINAREQVVGFGNPAKGTTTAFFWDGGAMVSFGGARSFGAAINDADQAAGSAENLPRTREAVRWSLPDYTPTFLGTLGGPESEAFGLNNAGRVVGSSDVAGGAIRAFFWRPDVGLVDLRTLGGDNSRAYAVNNVDQAVGTAQVSGGAFHAFVWQTGQMRDLNTLIPADSGWELQYAYSINDSGLIVGKGQYKGQTRAFLLRPSAE